jgi:hypothetical protein
MFDVTHRMRDFVKFSLIITIGALSIGARAMAADTELKREYSAKDLARMQSLTPDYFRQSATVADDALEPIATITTDKGFNSRGRFTDRVRSDNFFRALVDKATGITVLQLYAEVSYNFEWRNFTSASVLMGGRPKSIPLTIIDRKVVTCASGLCSYKEIVAIPLTENEVKEIAAGWTVTGSRPWPYRLKATNGMDFEDAILPAEAAGILAAVDTYRRKMDLPFADTRPQR